MLTNKQYITALLLAGMSLGTAWAIRGQFGHEQGAAWAGTIGALAVILIAKRADWYNKALKAALAAGLGWGIGGIMSYGKVVGFGRGNDFGNVYYGLVMLLLIGGIQGFLGGGLFGLALSDSSIKPVKWHLLVIEMTVGALLTYFFLIEQWGWLMTPPRSELWAACLGMGLALLTFTIRNQQRAALRVAAFSSLGAGFGFAFGNFLQVMGSASDLSFNFWNVMEYSIGFFGGVGMAYGAFTSQWETVVERQGAHPVYVPLAVISVLIPFVVWEQSFETGRLEGVYRNLMSGDVFTATRFTQIAALVLIAGVATYWFSRFQPAQGDNYLRLGYPDVQQFFLVHLSLYILLSFLITGSIISTYRPEQFLYIVNLILTGFFLKRTKPIFSEQVFHYSRLALGFVIVLVFIALITLVAINSHEELAGVNKRFE
nr:hypothetical protein [uncultured Arsenicibacter sp.]